LIFIVDMEYKHETVSIEELLLVYIDILYEDILNHGIYHVNDLDINKPGVPYPVAKSVLDYLEKQEEYEKCQIVHNELINYASSSNDISKVKE